jgi:hypothetical protein
MFESGYHRLAFFFFVAAAAVWFYAFNEWWGIVAAILLCVPVGFVSALLPSMLVGTLRQVGIGDAPLTWLSMLAGVALGVFGLIAFDGPTRALIVLAGAGLVLAGVTLLKLRMNAMEYRYDRGELDEDSARFIEEIQDSRS